MGKNIKIIQRQIFIDNKAIGDQLILLFILNDKIKNTMLVPLPRWIRQCEEEVTYYPLYLN